MDLGIKKKDPINTAANIATPPSEGTAPLWLVRPLGLSVSDFFRQMFTVTGMDKAAISALSNIAKKPDNPGMFGISLQKSNIIFAWVNPKVRK